MENKNYNDSEKSKALRLMEYLKRLASLRTKVIRNITEYQKALWLKDIPRIRGAFSRAWGSDDNFDPEIWIEIKKTLEPEIPAIPLICQDWVEPSSLKKKGEIPELRVLTTNVTETSPPLRSDSGQSELFNGTKLREADPKIQQTWEKYLEEKWLPWAEKHTEWERIQKIYSELFSIHQEQRRLGEEFELVLGIGLLSWHLPNNQVVRRHLIVANCQLDFEAHLEKFTVRPMPDGPNLRPELDMIDVEFQPAGLEDSATSALKDADDDPWNNEIVGKVIKTLVHSLDSSGEYFDSLELIQTVSSAKPIVEYAPALILRKRSARGLLDTLNKIRARLENQMDLTRAFADLAEIQSINDPVLEINPDDRKIEYDGEVFFPKPFNEEQRRIVEKMQKFRGVLVQGPPGTGKSHTIANLICHLLAIGKRILVTAKTPRALQVLFGKINKEANSKKDKGLIPEEIRPLCISLLGDGLEEKNSMEASVKGILNKQNEWYENHADQEIDTLNQRLQKLREEKATLERRIRDIRESETHSQSVAEGNYQGTAARIAQAVNRNKNQYEWFQDEVPLNSACPLSPDLLNYLLDGLRRYTPEKRRELSLLLPEVEMLPENFKNLVEKEHQAREQEQLLQNGIDSLFANHLSKCDKNAIEEIRNDLAVFQAKRQRILAFNDSWVPNALRDILSGNPHFWRELARVTKDKTDLIDRLVAVTEKYVVKFPTEVELRVLLNDIREIITHLKSGGGLGRGPFRPKPVKDRIYLLKNVQVNGNFCNTLRDFMVCHDVLLVQQECEKLWEFWKGKFEKFMGPYSLQLQTFKALLTVLQEILSIETFIEQARKSLRNCPHLPEPVWSDSAKVEELISTCVFALARHDRILAEQGILQVEDLVSAVSARSKVHPITFEVLAAIRERDFHRFEKCRNYILDFYAERRRLQKVAEYLQKLRLIVPGLIREFEQSFDDTNWNSRVQNIKGAWHWAQAKFWVEDFIRKEDAPGLAQRIQQIENEINEIVAKLAALHAWSFCFSTKSERRITEEHRREMVAWQQSMKKVGKGTGKHAARFLREAKKHLNNCREAVPAWVMPLHRVWDTVTPEPEMFDVVIVDEASQCGAEALPLFYLGKKILVVGDDKQISPDAVGIPLDVVHRLMDEFLYDFKFKDSFGVGNSLFGHGEIRFNTRIALREHFRSMPEIIRFSNNLCYADQPLIPLRQYGPKRLPPLEHIFVESGYREGANNRVINQPEATVLVEKIVELCSDKRYKGKSMGVIVLQGEAQASLIEQMLLERIGASEMEARRLICGNPYSFQGDERDIIFLSMVAAPNERIGAFTKPADERRFNVAASRARDQMFLFHSVTCNDLRTTCLRWRLLQFFENTRPQEITGFDVNELERRAKQDNRSVINPPKPFDSWFEVDVALEISRKGFRVIPQFKVAGKRIDLVIEGGNARLAVECDGDEWHGIDQYEADMQRQRMLEREGIDWVFFRVSAANFYSNKDCALQNLWPMLEEWGIFPVKFEGQADSQTDPEEEDFYENDSDEEVEENDQSVNESKSKQNDENIGHSNRKAEDISIPEIEAAIQRILTQLPNHSCTIDSLTTRVLKELDVITRGKPRLDFSRRVKRCLGRLEKRKEIEKYKAKNWRIRLAK